MRKTMIALAFAAAVCLFPCAGAMPPADAGVAVTVNGGAVDTYGLALNDGGRLTVPLRPVAQALGATSVTWDADGNCARVTAPGLTLWVPFDREYLEANGRCWYVPGGVDVVLDRCLVPLDYLVWAFGAVKRTDGLGVSITTTGRPVSSAEEFYGADDLYWMSRIIQAEAGAEPLVGKIAVGNVVVNRALSDEFPDTIKAVIFDRRYGIQFTPAYSGSINNTPSPDSVAAAKLSLEGVETVDGALYFSSRRAAQTCWASRHYQLIAEISGHVFFG